MRSDSGYKDDASKAKWGLLPIAPIRSIIAVLMFGAEKYGVDNWQLVPDARRRYYEATMRHLTTWWDGEARDSESGLPHLAHAACCVLFLIWFDEVKTTQRRAENERPRRHAWMAKIMSLKSSLGPMLARLDQFGHDSNGKPIPPAGNGLHEMPVRESRPYVNATHLTEREEQEEAVVREARAASKLSLLNHEERDVMRLHEDRSLGSRTVVRSLPASELDEAYSAGWDLKGYVMRAGAIVGGLVVKSFPVQLTFAQIGALLSLSARQVHSRITTAHKKINGVGR